MTIYFKKILIAVVFIGFSFANAGSFDDFFIAIKRNNPSAMQTLLQRGFDPNTVDENGVPGLILAIREQSMKVVDVLVGWPKTNVEIRNAQDESPLMFASLDGHLELARKLIARDADVNKPGWTPLHYAATNGHIDVMRLLLEQHAYIDAPSPNGTTPLMMAAYYGTPQAVKLLLDEGADATLRNAKGMTALNFAQDGERPDAIKMLSTFVRSTQPRGQW